MSEVRFDRMVPADIVARREECNLAYLPVGVLEWHGPHMPFGTDYMTVAFLAEETARRFGGVAFPPMYYSDVRYSLHDCRREWRKSYMRDMKLPEAFIAAFGLEYWPGFYGPDTQPIPPDDGPPASEPLPMTPQEMERDFTRQIARTLLEIHLYGFRNIILLPGHGSNPQYCRQACEVYAENVRRRSAFGEPARAMTYLFIDRAKEAEPLLANHWIHADKWEGSFVMTAAPGTVRPDQLPRDQNEIVPAYLGEPYITETQGWNPQYKHLKHSFEALSPRNINEEYGRRQVEAALIHFSKEIVKFMTEQ